MVSLVGTTPKVGGTLGGMACQMLEWVGILCGWHPGEDGTQSVMAPHFRCHPEWDGFLGGVASQVGWHLG